MVHLRVHLFTPLQDLFILSTTSEGGLPFQEAVREFNAYFGTALGFEILRRRGERLQLGLMYAGFSFDAVPETDSDSSGDEVGGKTRVPLMAMRRRRRGAPPRRY